MPRKKDELKIIEFPHVIFRAMATVYLKRPVIFKAKKDQVVSNTNQIIVIDSNPYDKKGKLTQKARNQIIQETLKIAKESRHRMCAVFGKKDCVYCEPNGSTMPSDDLPRTTFKIGGKDVDVTDVLSDRLQS